MPSLSYVLSSVALITPFIAAAILESTLKDHNYGEWLAVGLLFVFAFSLIRLLYKELTISEVLEASKKFKMRKDQGRMKFAIGSTQQPMQMQSGQKMPPAMLTNQVTQRIMKDPRTMGNLMKDPKFLNILNSIKNKRASSNANSQGRQGYRYGSPPVRTNQAGITELDYRQKGGFVPPIGVKEKADDIPAMLSNNEFVLTANAVRNAGGGSVKEGAKKMYSLMRQLEGRS